MRRMVAVGLVPVWLLLAGGMQAQTVKKQVATPLEKTQWTLTWVGGEKVASGSPRPAYIELDPGTHRLSGSGGCNRLMGGYALEGDHLRLNGTARTMMACVGGMDTEDKLVKALEETREWRVSGQELELLDGSQTVVARFKAGEAK